MCWLLWAKVNGEWVFFGDFRLNEETDRVLQAVYNTTEDQSLCLYVDSLGNNELQ